MHYNLYKEKVFSPGDNPLNKLHHALRHTPPADLQIIKQYAQWLRLRRYVKDTFYLVPQTYWIKGTERVHWVG